ncbi:MAG: hypothetical protein OXC60_09505 [Litoreibacter sp.]|nr:hypothetical protein [Litoreibacter sp.]
MRTGLIVGLSLLAACASTDERLLVEAGIPDSVLERLPEGVDEQAVGLEGGCYLYDREGAVVFVEDDDGNRICVE